MIIKGNKKIQQYSLIAMALAVAVFTLLLVANQAQSEGGAPVEIIPAVAESVEKESAPEESKPIAGTVEEQIRAIAGEVNFKWPDYLVKLAKCESRLNPSATNSIGNSAGVDRGLFQINDFYHREVPSTCAFSIDCSTRWTIERINQGYQHEWSCDRII